VVKIKEKRADEVYNFVYCGKRKGAIFEGGDILGKMVV
jgi:hypothetical protein